MQYKNPFQEEGRWYKANLHTHTTESDGHMTPADRAKAYREKGYSVLALTDHWFCGKVTDIRSLSTDGFLLLPGIECHPKENDIPLHILALNVPADIKFHEDENVDEVINRINSCGAVAISAHPYWLGLNVEDIIRQKGIIGIELYNSTCARMSKAFSTVHWDDLLQRGVRTIGIAVDDAHSADGDVFDGWVWLKMKDLNAEEVIRTLRKGCFYSSRGPEIKDISIHDGKMYVECSPVAYVDFIAERWNSIRVYAKDGGTITSAERDLSISSSYIRVECTDANGLTAWSNPFFL